MCVIAYKAKDIRFPSEENINDMWHTNPDGAGIMWRDDDGLIHWKKGFMKLKKFKRWVRQNQAWLEKVECALHFRITTHGGTSKGNCHPFAVDGDDVHRLEGNAKCVLMHNGVLPLKPRANDVSDSGELALRLSTCENPRNTMETLNECVSGNRIILMDDTGTHFFGDPFKKSTDDKNEGILYSNLNFEFKCFFESDNRIGYSIFRSQNKDEMKKPLSLMWDSCSKCWIDPNTGETYDERDVDSDSIPEEEWEAYQEDQYEEMVRLKNEFGLSEDDLFEAEADAYYCGLTTRKYLEKYFSREKQLA